MLNLRYDLPAEGAAFVNGAANAANFGATPNFDSAFGNNILIQ
jgi:hypothetical protein